MGVLLTRIYTDGSYSIKREMGSYGIVLVHGDHEKQIKGEIFTDSTSQRMEIMAVIVALETISDNPKWEYLFNVDSQYVINAINKKWVFRWEQTNFEGYKNGDLWIRFLKRYREFDIKRLRFKWVKGHVGNKYNEIADDLAGHWRENFEQEK